MTVAILPPPCRVDLRQQRFAQFVASLPAHPRTRALQILDVGGTVEYWQSVDWSRLQPCEVTLINLTSSSQVLPPFKSVCGDARDLSAYIDHSVDVVFSNSVIGHVGDAEDRARMAAEIRRVAKWYCVQTPNFWFPFDWRSMMPLYHWLPRAVQAAILCCVPVGRFRRTKRYADAYAYVSQVSQLTARDVRRLFPEAMILRERVFGLTKSFLVIGGSDAPQ